MFAILAQAVSIFSQVLTLSVLAHVILSYFLDPYHPIRVFIDRLVEPLLTPIRRVVPTLGMIDFSPMILIVLVQFISGIIVNFLLRL